MKITIEALQLESLPLFNTHFVRHAAESGSDNFHFMPFSPKDTDGPDGLNIEGMSFSLTTQGWQRWFVAFDEPRTRIVGHIDLKGSSLKTELHRCELGIGIELPFRGQGLGRRLMNRAITLCRETESLTWLDLKVFRQNKPAVALYQSLGFKEVGTVVDRFRIDGESVDDVIMTLPVADS